MLVIKAKDVRGIVLCTWSYLFSGKEVMALTDQDGFIPGQIYYHDCDELPNERIEHGEFITGPVFCIYVCVSVTLICCCIIEVLGIRDRIQREQPLFTRLSGVDQERLTSVGDFRPVWVLGL